MITILTEVSVHLNQGNQSNLCSPHNTVSEVDSEHFVCCQCSFLKFEATTIHHSLH